MAIRKAGDYRFSSVMGACSIRERGSVASKGFYALACVPRTRVLTSFGTAPSIAQRKNPWASV